MGKRKKEGNMACVLRRKKEGRKKGKKKEGNANIIFS